VGSRRRPATTAIAANADRAADDLKRVKSLVQDEVRADRCHDRIR
jgi:hypothetical protein